MYWAPQTVKHSLEPISFFKKHISIIVLDDLEMGKMKKMDHVSAEFHCIVIRNVFSCSKDCSTKTEHIVASITSH